MTPTAPAAARPVPDYPQTMGHPRPLWMLFMTEFWERFAFYGMRWALTLYIVAQFFNGDQSGQAYASRTYGAYLALVYASAIFGGWVADRILGYQRSILVGAAVMGSGLFMVMVPNQQVFLFGLATVIVGNGLFKPNISSLVGQIYPVGDDRRDRGFTIFYMGINLGGFLAPLVTGWLASVMTDTPLQDNYKAVFAATGVGMVICFIWFLIGKRQLQGVGVPPPERHEGKNLVGVIIGIVVAIPLVYLLMAKAGAIFIAWLLGALFIGVAVMLVIEAVRHDRIQIHRVIAMLLLFTFNVLFWMFFEQAGSSFNFLGAEHRRPPDVRLGIPHRLVPVGEFRGHPRLRAHRGPGLGLVGAHAQGAVDPAQVRPGPHLQRAGLPRADVCAEEPRGRQWPDPVLAAGGLLRAADHW